MTGQKQVEVGLALAGHEIIFEDYENDGPMWSGDGEREVRKFISFERPFLSSPLVQTHVSLLDARTEVMIRYSIYPENISLEGFDLVFSTWEDSKYARVHASWSAFGPAIRDEYWADF